MLNLFYDVVTYQKLTPYLGVGVGYAQINPKDSVGVTKIQKHCYGQINHKIYLML